MSTAHGVNAWWILLGLLLAPGSGCLDTVPNREGTVVMVDTSTTPRTREDFEQMNGSWGLWDPRAPPEGTVLGFWIWGSTEADGTAGCQDRFRYTGPDPPPVAYTLGSGEEVWIEVPFGMGRTDEAS